jgi:hypothetical protein
MTKRYEVTHVTHYIGGRLVYPGEVVTLEPGVEPGRWLKLVGEDAPAAAAIVIVDSAPQFAAKHGGKGVGVGNYVVVCVADGSYASQVFKKGDGDAKEKAVEEAARLNDGGEIVVAPVVAPVDPVATGQDGQAQVGAGLPDA